MNKRMLRKMRWRRIRLYPIVHSLFPDGSILLRDWPWIVLEQPRNELSLQNITTGHVLEVPFSAIYNYDENALELDKILNLRSKVWITALDAKIKDIDWQPSMRVAFSGRL